MGGTVHLKDVAAFIDQLLDVSRESDREGNGLALTSVDTVTKIGAAVNTSFESIEQASESNVDLLLVHHAPWTEIDLHLRQEKLAQLKAQGISLYAAHEALDRAPIFGTADALASLLKFSVEGRCADGAGVFGRFSADSFDALVEQIGCVLSVPVESWRNTSAWSRGAILTGAAGYTSYLQEAKEAGCDTYVTGEGSLYTKLFAREVGINLVFGSHYATEFPGIKALGQRVAEEFGLPWEAIAEDPILR